MNFAGLFQDFLSLVSGHPVLERLFFASVEFAALATLVWVAIRLARIKSARLIALLWLVVLAKPIVSLAFGSPLHVLKLEVARTEGEEVKTEEAVSELTPPARVEDATSAPLSKGGPGGVALQDIDAPFARNPDENFFPSSFPPTEFANVPTAAPTDAPAVVPLVEPEPDPAPTTAPARWDAATILIALWLAGVAFFAFRSALDRFTLRRLIRRTQPPDAELSAHYIRLVARFGVRRPPRLKVTDELESPALIGSLDPTILIPHWLATKGDSDKIDWALRHELMHWKLLDPMASLVREIAQALFYFHPAAWWAGRNWEVAAELACDRAIITDEADSQNYAAQLYGMLVEIHGRRRIR